MSFVVRRATAEDKAGWLGLRQKLWPEAPADYLLLDMDRRLADPDHAIFVTSNADGKLVAFIGAGPRAHCEGCETSPVGYIEAWYVDEHVRGQRLGREPVYAAEGWARKRWHPIPGWIMSPASRRT